MFKSLGVSLSFITSGSLALFFRKKTARRILNWSISKSKTLFMNIPWLFHFQIASSLVSFSNLEILEDIRGCFMVQEQLPVGRRIHHHWSKKNWLRYEGLWGTRCRWTPTCPWPNWSGTPKCDLNPGRIWKDSCGRLVSSRNILCL